MKITMYELLGMIKDDKAPKKVKYINSIWEYDKKTKDYFHDDLWLIYSMNSIGLTEREVEILEEEKEIPEKIKSLNNVGNSSDIGEFKDKQQLNNHLIKDKLNEIIDYLDYLKSKGE